MNNWRINMYKYSSEYLSGHSIIDDVCDGDYSNAEGRNDTIGFELELNYKNDSYFYGNLELDRWIRNNTPTEIFLKSDCTIGNGIEFVSLPYNYNYYISHYRRFNNYFSRLKQLGFNSIEVSEELITGLHIHLNKHMIYDINNMNMFIGDNFDWIKRFSKRKLFYDYYFDKERLDQEKRNTGKYSSQLYRESDNTYEIRFFKGYNSFPWVIIAMQLCICLGKYSKYSSTNIKSFIRYVNDSQYTELQKYIKTRKGLS
jgi:hypothetical protein